MAYWVLKSEPESWSWKQQQAKGEQGEWWDGVRNYQAANNLRAMRKGDLAFFYHSGKKPSIVGVVEVCAEATLDPSDSSKRFVMVQVRSLYPLRRPVPLSQLKKEVSSLSIVRQPRLSVAPVTKQEWDTILMLGKG